MTGPRRIRESPWSLWMLPVPWQEFPQFIVLASLAHAWAEYPRESCGLVVRVAGELTYRPYRNLAEGQAHFHLAPEDFARAEADGEVVAVVHSHPNAAPEPSEADRVMCERWGLPWLIVNVPVGHWCNGPG
ncbi:C40 family peptidase [Corallococcus terminator]